MLHARHAQAWILAEHARITQAALDRPEIAGSALVREIESALRVTSCAPNRPCPSLATLAALAGDHSCTTEQLGQFLTSRDDVKWIQGALEVAEETRKKLESVGDDSAARAQIRRATNVDLQTEDGDYLARAVSDYAHFQLAREHGLLTLDRFLAFALADGQQMNATAAYVNYHLVALRLANGLRTSEGAVRIALLRRAWLAESFALHFLEDSFSSGHFVGHWGSQSLRIGTHDAYSNTGIEAIPWTALDAKSLPYTAHGDAFLTSADLQRASRAVATSIEQVLATATREDAARQHLAATEGAFAAESFDACLMTSTPPGLSSLVSAASFREVLAEEPIPYPREPPLPRVRAEKGLFVGAAAALEGGYAADSGAVGRFGASLRVGIGAAGISNDVMNAQAFIDLGVVGADVDAFSSRRESTLGWLIRVRAPGLFPFDGLIALPLAAATENPTTLAWATAGARGGPVRYARTYRLFSGVTWQVSIARDVTFHLFGDRTEILAPFVTARSQFDMAGESPGQSVELWFDAGGAMAWAREHPGATFGGYVAISIASRLFPKGALD